MKKKQKINKAVNPGEWILLGLTALFLCFLFAMRERPAPERGISVRTAADRSGNAAAPSVNAAAPVHTDSVPTAPVNADSVPAAVPETPPDNAMTSPDSATLPDNAVTPPDSSVAPPDNADGRVNLNTADLQSLRSLPGIGDALAGRIIAYREEHGPFARPEDVMRVSGIGQGKFDAMKALITV